MPKLHISIDIPSHDGGGAPGVPEEIEITHLATRVLSESDLQAPHTTTPGVSVFIPQADSLELLVDSRPALLVPGLAYLLGGDMDRRLGAAHPGEETDKGTGSVLAVDINALINNAVPLRETLRLPTQLDPVASEEAERLCTMLLGHEKSLFLPAGSADVMRHMIAVQLVTLLLVAAGPGRPGAEGEQEEGKLLKLKQFMMRNLGANPSVLDMSRHLGMSRTGFYTWATPLLGEKPAQYHRKLRLAKSQELLFNSSLSIDQIAEMTGFCSRHHLTREFTKHYQTTPAKARRLAGQQPAIDPCSEADALIRDHQFSQALAVCKRGLKRANLGKNHSRLRYQQGRCLYALGEVDESVAIWESLTGTAWAHEAGKQLCNHFFRRGKYARAVSILADLYPDASPSQRHTLILTWSHRVAELINRRLRKELPHYLAVREELFADDVRSMAVTVDALNGLGMANRVPDHCPGLPERCFMSLRRAGLYRQAIDAYGAHVGAGMIAGALMQAGQYEEALAKAEKENLPALAADALVKLGRAEEAIIRYPDHCQQACLATGRYQELLDRWPEPSPYHIRALQALGRTDALLNYSDPGSWLWLYARFCADPVCILALEPRQESVLYYQALFIKTLAKLQAGDNKDAEELLDKIPLIQSPKFWWLDRNALTLLLTTVVRGLTGSRDLMTSELQAIRDHYRYIDTQKTWHDACFLLGDIDEKQYRNQPCQAFLGERLRLVEAIASDLAGDMDNAREAYRAVTATINPETSSLSFQEVSPFVAWRLSVLA